MSSLLFRAETQTCACVCVHDELGGRPSQRAPGRILLSFDNTHPTIMRCTLRPCCATQRNTPTPTPTPQDHMLESRMTHEGTQAADRSHMGAGKAGKGDEAVHSQVMADLLGSTSMHAAADLDLCSATPRWSASPSLPPSHAFLAHFLAPCTRADLRAQQCQDGRPWPPLPPPRRRARRVQGAAQVFVSIMTSRLQ